MSTRISDRVGSPVRISSVLEGVEVPIGTAPYHRVPFEQTEEYREMRRRMLESRLRKAGLRGAYVKASSTEGHDAFGRFERGRGTYFHGLPGRGKTYAAACCVRLAVLQGRSAKLLAVKALLDSVKAGYDGGDRSALERAERYELLALDDLGMERPTEWAMETIEGLVDARSSGGLPTVFTSNYPIGKLRDLWGGMQGARIASRIAGSCDVVEIAGEDRRLHGRG